MSEFTEHAWILWGLAAILAALIELLIPYFTFSFVAVAAALAGVSSVWAPREIQVLVFCVTLLSSLFFLRPFFLQKFHVPHKIHSRSTQLLNLRGQVTELIDATRASGRVTVNGEDWSAQAETEAVVAVGTTIEVIGSDGIVLIVKEV